MRLFSYKMKNDNGFAPNPFKGFLTLANCKPGIRKTKEVGDWIAGFTSKNLNGDNVGMERLLYLMKITEKITYCKYWTDTKYNEKKPNLESKNMEDKAGDNIYMPLFEDARDSLDFKQIENKNHGIDDMPKDLSGLYVLISTRFYYFGSDPIDIDREKFNIRIPISQAPSGWKTDNAEQFITYVENYAKNTKPIQKGIYAYPHHWERNDKTNNLVKPSQEKSKKGCSTCK